MLMPQRREISLTDLKRQDAEKLYEKGIIKAYKQELYDEAIGYFDKAITTDTNFAAAWHMKGKALANLGKYKEAIRSYDKALKINPTYADASNSKAVAQVMTVNPKDANALAEKAQALSDLGCYEEAGIAFEYQKKLG
jgi:tetratricopeptide (TPR) repeat protein